MVFQKKIFLSTFLPQLSRIVICLFATLPRSAAAAIAAAAAARGQVAGDFQKSQ